jgi:protein tyrosine phosphatase (PTP) superfamily phosphohydrolase (DUF442 family)/cytochrome c556
MMIKMRSGLIFATVLSCGLTGVSCQPKAEAPKSAPVTASTPGPASPASTQESAKGTTAPTTKPFGFIDLKHVHNVHRVTDKVISGSQPEGPEGLAEIAALGVKTIISVDGITPDAENAKKLGMRYIHLPISYDGVTEQRGKEIAKAIQEMPGPIYIHCHHGKHRSAGAVAVACVYAGELPISQAEAVLKTFGTGLNYKGLWKAAADARPVDPHELKNMEVAYVEKTQIADMAAWMVKVDDHFDHLKAIQKAGWAPPSDHPDLDPPHEALQLEEALTESMRGPDGQKTTDEFKKMMQDNIVKSQELKAILSAKPIDKKAADAAMKAANTSCLNCHKVYRDQ